MKQATNKIIGWFKEKNLNYDLQKDENGNDLFIIPCSLKNINNTQIFAIIGEDDIQMAMLNYINVPENKKTVVVEKINELNSKYRWIKLQLENGCVSSTIDAVFDDGSLLSIWDNLILRITTISETCYPEIMKVLWR